MDPAIMIAILGACVSIVGWIVNHILSDSAQRRRERLMSKIEFTRQQLEELYGPLVFLVLGGRRTYNDLLEVLGRNFVFYEGNNPRLPEDELDAWRFWTEYDFLPRNEKMRELIASKTYLVEGEEVPESWLAFLDHHSSWKIHHDRWKEDGVEYDWKSKVNWPSHFKGDVVSVFTQLKKRHAELVGRI
jgi:hypothetical protein